MFFVNTRQGKANVQGGKCGEMGEGEYIQYSSTYNIQDAYIYIDIYNVIVLLFLKTFR